MYPTVELNTAKGCFLYLQIYLQNLIFFLSFLAPTSPRPFSIIHLRLVFFFVLTAAAGYRAAESHGGSGGRHAEVRPERSVESDG